MLINLEEIIQPYNLRHLDDQFTIDEIETVAKEFPTDRAPGLDGFNGLFLRKFWNIIKQDFYTKIWGFFRVTWIFKASTLYITLIPKK